MLDFVGVVLGVPAGAFFIVAVAIGANPFRAAAWGAIFGALGMGAIIYVETHQPVKPIAWQPPTYAPTDEMPAKPDPFADLIPQPAPQPYKVPPNEQHRPAPGDPPGMY